MNDSLRSEKSDEMFIEWSKGRKEDSWDVLAVSELISHKGYAKGLDVGGGIGTFSKAISATCQNIERIDVLDPSISARKVFTESEKVKLISKSLQNYNPDKDQQYDFVMMILVLHHIIGRTDKEVFLNQINFILKAVSMLKSNGLLIVEENVYDSVLSSDLTGRLIYEITRCKFMERLSRKLGANTAGEGVRFHSEYRWSRLFRYAQLEEINCVYNRQWGSQMPFWQKIPLLCSKRFQKLSVLCRLSSDVM